MTSSIVVVTGVACAIFWLIAYVGIIYRGFNDKTYLDGEGLPHSEDLRITERYRRPDFGHLVVEFTFTDPKYYERPWSATIPFDLMPDTELIEHFCENEKDLGQLIRK